MSVRDTLAGAIARTGFEIRPVASPGRLGRTHPDMEPAFRALHERCAPYSMTSPERMYAVWQAVRHVLSRDVQGDVVECGVWRGGSSLLAALTLAEHGGGERRQWLYDTFEGMSEPEERDVSLAGDRVADRWDALRSKTRDPVLAYASLEDVKRTMAHAGPSAESLVYVVGKVEVTIPDRTPERIALLRLDTDWYASTRHELEHLYPRLAPGGVLIVDDYGHWQGAREAVDEYFATLAEPPLLQRTDYTGRMAVKPS